MSPTSWFPLLSVTPNPLIINCHTSWRNYHHFKQRHNDGVITSDSHNVEITESLLSESKSRTRRVPHQRGTSTSRQIKQPSQRSCQLIFTTNAEKFNTPRRRSKQFHLILLTVICSNKGRKKIGDNSLLWLPTNFLCFYGKSCSFVVSHINSSSYIHRVALYAPPPPFLSFFDLFCNSLKLCWIGHSL